MAKGRSEGDLTEVYTDGGARPNPGPAGWGAVILRPGEEPLELSGGESHSTNNRMELTAAIRALEELGEDEPAHLHTDSLYLRKGVTEWLPRWVRQGWKRKGGAVENEDLWRRLQDLDRRRDVRWKWVKGHAGHEWNEHADRLASEAIAAQAGDGTSAAMPRVDCEIFVRVSSTGKRGGWAATVRRAGEDWSEETRVGTAAGVSANQLDLMAAAELLEAMPEGSKVAVYSGSDYLRLGASRWIHGWRKRGWTTKTGKPVANRELWERLQRAEARLAGVRWPEPGDEAQEILQHLERRAREARQEGPAVPQGSNP